MERDDLKYQKLIVVFLIMVFGLTGCKSRTNQVAENNYADTAQTERKYQVFTDSKKIAEGYSKIYEEAEKTDRLDGLELKQQIVNVLGQEGYAAVDIGNQIDMVNAEQVERFCKNAEKKQTAKILIFSVMEAGGFVRYDMETQNGEIDVEVSSCVWKEGKPIADHYQKFQAHTWKYTENGYFFIEEYHPSGYDGPLGQIVFRVKPLDKTCRELNRKYVLPIGYELNKLLITDWDENNYKNLDFYDLFELMYRLKYGKYVPYDHNYSGAEYEIPQEEFEEVIQTYIKIDSRVLQDNAVFHTDTKTYRYRPRGLYDCEFPYEPYPEVINYEIQNDGTIKLTINAVWVREKLDQAFTSELVVRPLENGKFQYVSNFVLSLPGNIEPNWYRSRLSDEEWTEIYERDR